jgi:MoaA/NifB/PqqE/SkfB family radical SAM enzyme
VNLKEKIIIGARILESIIFKKSNIISVEFSLTHRCNLSCKYCVLDSSIKKEMATQEIKEAFSALDKLHVERVNLSGGEPLIRKDIVEILEAAFRNKFKTTLTTNGILVPVYLDLLQNLDLLIISIDGKEATHDFLRGQDTHKYVLNAIDLSQKKEIKLLISAVISRETTEKDLEFLLKLCDFYDIFCVLQPVSSIVFKRGILNIKKIEKQVPDIELLEHLYGYLKKHPSRKRILGYDNFAELILSLHRRRQDGMVVTTNCLAGLFFLYIDCDGSVYPCSMRLQKLVEKHFPESYLDIKNIKTQSIKCYGCTCFTYRMLNNLANLDFKSIIYSLYHGYT